MSHDERDRGSEAPTVPDKPDTGDRRVSLDDAPLPRTLIERYAVGAELGQGGMGQVFKCLDQPIGREVAMKVLSSSMSHRSDLLARFLREARVQGQLEHPCVAPVYDLGTTADGRPFFAMKRVRGTTLRAILGEQRGGDANAIERYGRHTLLSAFARICLAVHAAHRRGVVHRDIKPENIMLGDYGEVYLMDWGIAGLIDAPDLEAEGAEPDEAEPVELSAAQSEITRAGEMLGTPQYMAPEQRFGVADPRADVYSLGAVLYEILTLQPAVEHLERQAPEMEAHAPPELIAACRRACEFEPADRFQSARELHSCVQSYLEGNRDLEKRKTLAAELARTAAADAETAYRSGPEAQQARARALRQIGRSLALDPDNADAARTLLELMTTPPSDIPPEAEQRWQEHKDRGAVEAAHGSVPVFAAILAFVPLVLWMGVQSWSGFAFFVGAQLAAIVVTWGAGRWYEPGGWGMFIPLMPVSVSVVAFVVVYGPFFVTPALAALCAASFALHLTRVQRLVMGFVLCLAVFLPFGAEAIGIAPASLGFRDGVLEILPRAIEFPDLPTLVFLTTSTIAFIIAAVLFFGRVRETLYNAERALYLQTWQLEQVVPHHHSPS